MKAWRFIHHRHVDAAFTGEGTRLYGSRWISEGNSAVYVSDSAAQAVLETLVRLDDVHVLVNYVLCTVDVPEDSFEDIVSPPSWRDTPPPLTLQQIGDRWLEAGSSLALRVPSVLVPGDNFILNPSHEDFASLRPEQLDWVVDPRLAR